MTPTPRPVVTEPTPVAEVRSPTVEKKKTQTWQDLVLLDDGPSDFTYAQWTALKTHLFGGGSLLVTSDDLIHYRNTTDSFLPVFRAMADGFEECGFDHPSGNQIYNGARALTGDGLSQVSPERAARMIQDACGTARITGMSLMSRADFERLEVTWNLAH